MQTFIVVVGLIYSHGPQATYDYISADVGGYVVSPGLYAPRIQFEFYAHAHLHTL